MMRNSDTRHGIRRAKLSAFILAALLAVSGASASAQHEGHHHGTPKPSLTPTPTPTPAPAPQQTPQAPSTTSTKDAQTQPTPGAQQHDQHGAGQHDHHGTTQAQPAATPAATPAAEHEHHGATGGASGQNAVSGPAAMHGAGDIMVMDGDDMGIRVGASGSNFLSMGQMGSGTSWQPASTPMHMLHKRAGDWLLMFHGEAKLGVNSQGGPRGVTKFESQNWVMPMAFRRVGRGTLQLRAMLSLEPLTFSGAGSPQLFQTGEVYQGRPIIDAQHPHDLFMELSASYTMPVGERGTWYAYVGFPGEPALGPVAFMHRASASENPTAPLAHHLQDSTHISYGVVTTGVTYRGVKFEGSLFNGREPDDRRYNFEFNPWNSRSLRVSYAPNANWTMQYSYGFLKNPEFFAEGDTHRQTASIQYNRPFERGNWASALIWGRNRESHHDETFRLNSYLAESTINFLDRNYLYTRLELVDREGEDLLRHDELHALGFHDDEHPQFRIGAYTFGGARDIWTTDKLSVALGGDLTFYSKPDVLDTVYGRNPTSYKFFIRIRPGRMKMDHSTHGAGAHTGHGDN